MEQPSNSVVRAWVRAILQEILKALDAPPPKLPAIEEAIMEVATDWIGTKALASKAGYVYGGGFRGIVADMVRRGILLRGPDGVKRATAQ